ncbi:unnamed protein product [Cuscuta epithymum]|uniref:PHD finger protein n=1 Tax=Cuscuta epithymum TaxID=186058 RepID=A0AAV0GET2_9ASTE|nr:unnamed protein product [Cuscuta epithymum]
MESTVGLKLGDVGEKRHPDEVELDGPPAGKKPKRVVGGNVKKVAELVLVLAAMGKMRGGWSPTDAEKEMMVEARDKLAQVCQTFAPKDVFPRDAFGGLIEDLGLNKLNEQKLGFHPPKMSIAEKILISKRKMEKPEEGLQSALYSSQCLQSHTGVMVENRGPPNATRIFPADKTGHAHSSSSFQPGSAPGQGPNANSTSLPYQLPTNEIKPTVHNGLAPSNVGKGTSPMPIPHVERPHLRSDGRSNGASHIQASSADHPTLRSPNWMMAPSSHSASKVGPETGATVTSTGKVESVADHKSGMVHQVTTSRPFINQTSSGNLPNIHQHMHGMSFVPGLPPSIPHVEVGKIVQRFLQPHRPDRPAWTPPSRDYMSKPLTCQMCKSTVNDVDNVLVCDACEKGYHLKCLQMTNPKGIPRGEWHCVKCLALTNGKPLPPKYGRVMRNINAPKISSNAIMAQPCVDKKVSCANEKMSSQQKVAVNGNVALQNPPTVDVANRVENGKEMQGNDTVSSIKSIDSRTSSESCPNSTAKASSDNCVSLTGSSADKSCQENSVDLKQQPHATTNTLLCSSENSHPSLNLPNVNHLRISNCVDVSSKHLDNHLDNVDLKESFDRDTFSTNSNGVANIGQQEVLEVNTADDSKACNEIIKGSNSSSNCVNIVDWAGSKLPVEDEKNYYEACRVNGCVYSPKDYALIRFENDRLIPSQIQTMWEDTKTGTKWVAVNRCYFPRDLPASVGRPCSLENNEVYLSNFGSTVMAGLIHGPCEVLPSSRFTEERERRTRAGTEQNDSGPLYLCKWFFDEAKGLFRDVSC